ncbi:MAG: CvpA family protein [Methyloligellaceae bacterium]
MPLSWLDVGLVVIMLISGFLAMLRGLTREVLAILSWALAAVATLFFWPQYRDVVRGYISPEVLADIVLAAGIFIFVLIVVSLITVRVADKVLDSRIGALDRTLGFVFGLARGLILVVIAYLFFSWLVPQEDQPQWVQNAQSLPIIQQTGDIIISLLPENPASVIPGAVGGSDQQSSIVRPNPNVANSGSQGYRSGERRGLNQLLEGTQAAQN